MRKKVQRTVRAHGMHRVDANRFFADVLTGQGPKCWLDWRVRISTTGVVTVMVLVRKPFIFLKKTFSISGTHATLKHMALNP